LKLIEKIKRLIQNYGVGGIGKSLHLAISQSFVAVLFILTDYIFSKQLTVAEFGIWKETFFFLNFGIPLLAFGLPEGYKYFIAKEKNIEHYSQNTSIALLIIAIGLEGILLVLNGLQYFSIIDLGSYYGYSLLFPLPLLAFLMNKTLRYSYINLDQAERLTKFSIYGGLGSLVLVFAGMLLISSHGEYLVLVAVLVYFGIFFLPALFYLRGFVEFSFSLKLDRSSVRKMLVYGLPLYLATFTGLLTNYLDKLIVNVAADETTFAIFAVGAFEIPIFAILSAAFSQQIFPKMVRCIEDGEEKQAKSIWIATTKKVSLLTYPLILVVMFFAEEIIFLIYNENYQTSVVLFKTYLLVALFRNNSYGILLACKGDTKFITKVSAIVLLVNCVVSIILYLSIGLQGVVFGTLISTFLMFLIFLHKEKMLRSYVDKILVNKFLLPLILLILFFYFR
jgi:O-antigen/teichoic acid export membrane protein